MLFLVILFAVSLAFAQFANESFEGTFPPSGWTNQGCAQSTADFHTGTKSVLSTANGKCIYTPMIAKPGTFSVWNKKVTGNFDFNVQTSPDGTNWTTRGTFSAASSWTQSTVDLSAYSNVYIRLANLNSPNKSVYWDDVACTARTPSTQASAVNFSSVAITTVTLNWTRGNGDRIVVFLKESSIGTPGNPVNGTTYSPSTDWAAKGTQLGSTGYYCVYNGTGTTVNLTNLAANTNYYAIAYEYNGLAATSVYMGTGATANTTTLNYTQASNVNFTNVQINTFRINWTRGNATNCVVFLKQGTAGTPGNPTNGTTYNPNTNWTTPGTQLGTTGYYCVYNGTGSFVDISNLNANTAYYAIVYEYSGSGATSVYITNGATNNTTTLNYTQASNVNFTNVLFTTFRINWTRGNASNCVVFLRKSGAGTPGNPSNGTTYTPSTDWAAKGTQLGATGYYCVYNGTGTFVDMTNLESNTDFYAIVYEYSGTGPTSVYVPNGATGNTTTLALTENYFRTIATGNWNNPAIWEASPNGSNWFPAVGYPTAAAITTYLNHDVYLTQHEACDDLNFNPGGSVTFGNFNLTISGTITGQAIFYYTGTGLPSQETTTSNTEVTIPNPSAIPAILDNLTIHSGAGTVVIPNNVTYNTLGFTSGDFFFNGFKLTHNGLNIAYSSNNATMSALNDTYSGTVNVYNFFGVDNYSIAATWRLSGTFTGNLNLHFTYPKTESAAPFVRIWYRSAGALPGDAWMVWGDYYYGNPAIDNGTTMTVTAYGVNTLSDGAKGPLDWTISEMDQTLPVELSSFTAWLTQQYFVELKWVTQSESDAMGYHVYRNNSTSFGSAVRINLNIIPAHNTSNESSYSYIDTEATLGTWYYWLYCQNMNNTHNLYGPISITVTDPNGSTTPPVATNLGILRPNPFNPRVSAMTGYFNLSKAEDVSLTIYNIKGAKVKTIVSGKTNSGTYPITWDGRDSHGKICPSGMYYIVMTTSVYSTSRKIVILK